ncbi:STAS domain-containing protein [Conexibacter woesei]|uniref:STAS domain-containing protein n=1 Tax=Conexibacter woesei TaxID=191495 RepID=UPI00040243D0|nr:STAS domain-containing protein [Conexibacter woesei]
MDAGSFEITVEREDDVARLRLTGELDLARVAQLREAVQEAWAGGGRLEIDLRDLSFIDSSGLRALIDVHNNAESSGSSYVLIPGRPEVHRTFELTGLTTVFRFAEATA